MDKITIPEFFDGKTVFITGGSGFIGKVLVEKLLRSCPEVKNVYLLMRVKNGKTLQERIRAITDLPLFDKVKQEQPDCLNKIKIISGDVAELGLGISEEEREKLVRETNVIFHGAASVRFNDPLSESVIMNTRGTRELVKLSLAMDRLEVLVHISTTYCNTHQKTIGEQLYPPHADWAKTIEISEKFDKQHLNILTKKYTNGFPNTYTFAKSLGEHVVNDLCLGKVPVVIFRPSIVVSTLDEPFPGWIDNFNGPVGIIAASGKGVMRTVLSDQNVASDIVPVDLVVKALIIAAWKKALDSKRLQEISVYNGSNYNVHPVTIGEVVKLGRELCWETPLNDILWFPDCQPTTCHYNHYLKMLFYQILPAIFLDGLIKLFGYKPFLVRVQRRIFTSTYALEYFLTNEWQFVNDKTYALENALEPQDVAGFGFNKKLFDHVKYFRNANRGGRRYLFKEDDSSIDRAKRHLKVMWVLSQIFNVLWYLAIMWFLYKLGLVSFVADKIGWLLPQATQKSGFQLMKDTEIAI